MRCVETLYTVLLWYPHPNISNREATTLPGHGNRDALLGILVVLALYALLGFVVVRAWRYS